MKYGEAEYTNLSLPATGPERTQTVGMSFRNDPCFCLIVVIFMHART